MTITGNGVVNSINSNSDGSSIDPYGRFRVSQPVTLFDSKQVHDNLLLVWDDQEVSGAGTNSVYLRDTASTTLSVTLNTAGKRVRQTKLRFNYQPGKGQHIMFTGLLGAADNGITKEIIYGDDNNGLGFASINDNYAVIIRSSTSGSPIDTLILRSAWNLDKLDGSGNSGKTIDFTLTQVFMVDFQWLGVGRVRFGVFLDGRVIYVHEAIYTNIITTVYISTPNLPIRYSIENDGTGPNSNIVHICNTIISEGGRQELGINRYLSTADTFINANTVGIIYIICGLRLKSDELNAVSKLVHVTLLNSTADDYEWLLILNPVVANAVTFNDIINSSLQFAVGNSGNPSNSTVTGGTVIDGEYVKSGGGDGSIGSPLGNVLPLGAKIDGTVDEIYLCVRPLSSNANIYGGIEWEEL